MSEKALPPLDLTGPASQVAERWRKWKRAFEYFAEGKGIDNVRKKTSLLLHFAGMDVQDIFEDLQDPGPIPESGGNVYKIAIRKLDSYFRATWIPERPWQDLALDLLSPMPTGESLLVLVDYFS